MDKVLQGISKKFLRNSFSKYRPIITTFFLGHTDVLTYGNDEIN